VIGMGGGRRVASDRIDPRVGFSAITPIGMHVAKGDPLAFVHAGSDEVADQASAIFKAACQIAASAVVPDLVTEII